MSDSYHYPHSVAVCTLDTPDLQAQLGAYYAEKGIIVAPLRTENLGIEQIITFVLSQPSLRTIVLCGNEPDGAIGYCSGGTMLALLNNGVDERHRVIDAPGKRPILQNVTGEAIDHFRQQVHLVDAIGQADAEQLQALIDEQILAWERDETRVFKAYQGVVERVLDLPVLTPQIDGSIISDPAGYVVISVEGQAGEIVAKVYGNDGFQKATVKGKNAKTIYTGLLELKAVSRLDHAAYVGKELARAEAVLAKIQSGDTMAYFVQDEIGP